MPNSTPGVVIRGSLTLTPNKLWNFMMACSITLLLTRSRGIAICKAIFLMILEIKVGSEITSISYSGGE